MACWTKAYSGGAISDAIAVVNYQLVEKLSYPRWQWTPRPDVPGIDEQASFLSDYSSKVIVLLGGNGSGKTEATAVKVARSLCDLIPPPKPVSKFFVLSTTLDQACGVCWGEKLYGKGLVRSHEIDWKRSTWINRARDFPKTISLIPDYRGWRWELNFVSCEQGRRALQGYSIQGVWISEQAPFEILVELLRGMRETSVPGLFIYELTPVEPEYCVELEELYNAPPEGYKFYHLATEFNKYLEPGWLETFKASIADEMIDTRLYGKFAKYEGAVFQAFDPSRHVKEFRELQLDFISVDWGGGGPHATCALWCQYDYSDDIIYVRAEYYNDSEQAVVADHIDAIQAMTWGAKIAYAVADYENKLACIQLGRIIPVRPAKKDLFQSIEEIRVRLKNDKLIIHPSCKSLIRQMRSYRFANRQTFAVVKQDDHAVDALRYAVMSLPRQARHVPSQERKRQEVKLG